jgi:hypothetical protein
VGDHAHRGEVSDLPRRVGRRLDPQEPCPPWSERRLHGRQIGHVDELHVQTPG